MGNYYRQAIRQTNKILRKSLPFDYRHKASHRIYHMLKRTHFYRYAKHIGLYMASQGEVDLSPIWQAAPGQGKYCYFPSLLPGKKLAFLPATPNTDFKNNRFNIAEPNIPVKQAIDYNLLQIVLMPLVAFDSRGRRLGMGGGYYDRTFEHLKTQQKPTTHLIGIAYECQRQDWLPEKSWDVPLDIIVSDKQIYWCSERGRLFK